MLDGSTGYRACRFSSPLKCLSNKNLTPCVRKVILRLLAQTATRPIHDFDLTTNGWIRHKGTLNLTFYFEPFLWPLPNLHQDAQ